MTVFAIAEDGKGCVMMKEEITYSLIVNIGKPSKCNSCVLIVYGKTKDIKVVFQELSKISYPISKELKELKKLVRESYYFK